MHDEVDIPIENIGQEDKEKIIEVILPDGQVIQFKKNGAYYQVLPERVVGTSVLGVEESIDLSQILEIRLSIPEVISKKNFDYTKITEIITLQNFYIKIDENGCQLMDDQKTYRGKTIKGEEFKFRIDMVKEIRTGEAETISKLEVKDNRSIKVKEIIYKKGVAEKIITFDKESGSFVEQKYGITGVADGGKQMYIDINDILYVRVERVDTGATCLATVGCLAAGVGGLILLAAALKESCPFVYSYNGSQYIFDAEPLGGAISEGLKKADYSKLVLTILTE
jgi:hypothetical protein